MTQATTPSTKKKRCFLAITHIRQLDAGQWQTVEEVEVCTNLKNKHLNSATIIIDVMEQKFVKNRLLTSSDRPLEEHMAYLTKYIDDNRKNIERVLSA